MAEVQGNTKRCTKCGEVRACTDFYHQNKAAGKRSPHCRFCMAAYAAEWRKRNRAHISAKTKAYYAKHGEKIRAVSAEYQRADVERTRAYQKKWRGQNPENERARTQRWAESHPEWVSAKQAKRRAAIQGNGGQHTGKDLRRIYKEQCGLCFYCGVMLMGRYHADHKTPISRGGTSWPENMCCACAECNLKKGARTSEEFTETIKAQGAA